MARGNTWTNSDGLGVGFGTHTADNNVPAVFKSSDGKVTVTAEFTLADLPDTFAAANRSPQEVVIPRGSVITEAFLHTMVAPTSAGGTATLDVGLWGTNDVVDVADGIVADASITEMGAIGAALRCDGALILDAATTQASAGATANSDVVIAASYETQAFTAGVVRLVLTYIPPQGSYDTLAS